MTSSDRGYRLSPADASTCRWMIMTMTG